MSTSDLNSPEYDKTLLKSCGEGGFISAKVEIKRPQLITIGKDVAIDSGFYITTAGEFGDHIHIGPSVLVIGGKNSTLKLGNFVNLTLGTKFICGSDTFSGAGLVSAPGIPDEYLNEVKTDEIVVEDFASVCADSIIFPGVTIAEGSIIGANSVVTKSTEPWGFYFGSPAQRVKDRPKEKMLEYAKKLGY